MTQIYSKRGEVDGAPTCITGVWPKPPPRESRVKLIAPKCLRLDGRWWLYVKTVWTKYLTEKENSGPDLQNILRQSYDYLTIMPSYDQLTTDV